MIVPAIRTFVREKRYRNLTITTMAVLLLGILGFRFLEGWRWIDCVSYSVSIMVTAGNSDVYPKSDAGKIFNICYMFISVILILFFVNVLYQHFHATRLSRVIKHRRHQKIVDKQIEAQEIKDNG